MSKLQDGWLSQVKAYQESGKGQKEFASERGISPSQLNYWIRKFEESEPKFIELKTGPKVKEAIRRAELEIELSLPGGVVLRMNKA